LDKSFDLEKIQGYISSIPFVNRIYRIEQEGYFIKGKIEISFDLLKSLDFDFVIKPQYPLKDHDSESIKFISKELIKYNHVMSDGSICIHTSHCTDLERKLLIDFNSLKNWIVKYYLNSGSDENYEHLIVPESMIDNRFLSYIFAETEQSFTKGEFGLVGLTILRNSIYKEKLIQNYSVQNFESTSKKYCVWSNHYKNAETTHSGYFVFIETAPATYNKFIFENWIDLNGLIPDDFIQELHSYESSQSKNGKTILPVFIGYKTINDEIHWQVALLESGNFPIKGVPVKVDGVKTGKWKGELVSQKINWALSENASYSYFFGRGAFSPAITEKRILIIGIGAIGSILAKTLVRCGCKQIDLTDVDIKKPENICRSEYEFNYGLSDKVAELANILQSTSPHCSIKIVNKEYFESIIKVFHKDEEARATFCEQLNDYDIVFDSTTDNDLMYILNTFQLKCSLINMSITNHANELVCAFYPNIYDFVMNQFENVLSNDIDDLYNPTGCWSPTFKASYNDIDLLVQMGLKQINHLFSTNKARNNFIVSFDGRNNQELKIKEF